MFPEEFVQTIPDYLGLTEISLQAKVILFNDEVHTFEEVAGQIIKATGCSFLRADSLTLEVHTMGRAVVFEGAWDLCLRVSSVLEEIQLQTQVEC